MVPFCRFVVIWVILLTAGLSACAPAARNAGTPVAASSVEPAPTITRVLPTVTRTPTPVNTPNSRATANAQQTATAQAFETATQAALAADRAGELMLLARLRQDKSLYMYPGMPIPLADFSESLVESGANRIWPIDEVEPLKNFIITSHIAWQYPDDFPWLDAGSCGFVMRLAENENRDIIALLNTTNTLSLSQKGAGGYVKAGILAPWGKVNGQIRTREKSGEADIAIIAQRDVISLYINGEKDSAWAVAQVDAGKIGYMIQSLSNVSYGVKCSFTDTRVFPLK